MQLKFRILAALVAAAPGILHAQFNFDLAGRPVQVHSFGSQGFLYSNQNNYMSTHTSTGSVSFTDFGFNASTQISDKFRVGAQIYDYNLGHLGNWHPELDWAVADYRFKDWLGIRAGKVKTVMGLYNATQDISSLHTWALMPQSLYPLDRRGDTISHIGADLYGNPDLKRFGSLSYTVYAGHRPNDPNGGYIYAMSTSTPVFVKGVSVMVPIADKRMDSYSGLMYGSDIKWTTPLKGLTAGVNYAHLDILGEGIYRANNAPYRLYQIKDHMYGYALSYTLRGFQFDGEYRREPRINQELLITGNLKAPNPKDQRGGYVAATYRFTKWLELGAYHSRYYYNWAALHSDPNNHVFDTTISARFDLNRYLDLKLEGHFMDGNLPSATTNRGFYIAVNPGGFKPTTDMLVVRLGFRL